jgi:hypothetical protein
VDADECGSLPGDAVHGYDDRQHSGGSPRASAPPPLAPSPSPPPPQHELALFPHDPCLLARHLCQVDSFNQVRMAWGINGLPKVSLEPTMPYHSTPCGRPALKLPFLFWAHLGRHTTPYPLDTPCRTGRLFVCCHIKIHSRLWFYMAYENLASVICVRYAQK